jgi:acyl transferase domain-containing protein/acyl-CoA synthetase (AMP-forming)/AMP-acid ligase II/acyl carrier protein/NAD(P)-dependent dehydrogenase (short-subunit alcohol dehydrogenase family)/SAM-dependent methyltransferase
MRSPQAETLYDVLKFRAETQPDDPAYIFLNNGEEETPPLTYKQLHDSSIAFAAKLQSRNMTGERALLIFESGYEYIISFFGCIYAGVISVPLHPPGKNKSMSRISAISLDSDAKLILSTRELREELKNECKNDDVLKKLDWLCIDDPADESSPQWQEPMLTGDSITYLQYTSGSTGIPKGVIVSHENLVTNLTIIDKSHPHDENSAMVTWLPIHHDMGLIYGMLLPFFCGYPCYYMTPQAFVQKPYRWLHAISKYKGTHNAAPNFAFELCVNKVTAEEKKSLDLSTWKFAMNAAEPVRAETLNRFHDYFAECGFEFSYFKPGYGLAEGTLILSTVTKDDYAKLIRFDDEQLEKHNKAIEANNDDVSSKIHVGHSNAIEDTRIAIVNPDTRIECKEGAVGEVWAKGKSIAKGYWLRKEATEETFNAHISDTGEGPFLRTGDLGFIKNNELYITGRHKDLIIIRGQNHYPQDIEYTVEASHPILRLGCVAAFPIDEDGEEHIGIVQEVQKNFEKDFDADEVFKAIRFAVSKEHDLQIHSITLIKAQTIPKTSSGKIQRRACREGLLNGTLDMLSEWKQNTASDDLKLPESSDRKIEAKFDDIKQFLITRLSQLMQINSASIDPNEPFASYGMDSLKAVQISGDLEEFLHTELPATLVYDYPSINSLSEYLSGRKESNARISKQLTVGEKEPIAIVGIGLRFPGGNDTTEKFFNFLLNGGDAIREIPEGRWPESLMKENTIRLGGFLDDVDKFDPAFYGISPREALQIDPQQRLTLEVAWEALEDACIDPSTLAGRNVGVFMGVCSYDYARFSAGRKELFDVYTGTGTSLSIVANRISYLLDFRGPSIAIDTACSSSLVAVHTACRSLHAGESEIALAGGVNLLLNPDWNVVFTEADMLAQDGHCKTFDSKADGYVRSEGCGVVILKRLSDAVNDGDRIYAVINGSAINQDGKSNGLTAPNGPSQVDVIRQALTNSGINGDDIGYVEAHGTGTPLGDPIEVNSITEALNAKSRKSDTLRIGSVKTNIGHLEAAAGIAGIIKTSLAFYNGVMPAQINYDSLNPEIILSGLPVEVTVKNIPTDGNIRYAGISSFGFGGTNAHIILSPQPVAADGQKDHRPCDVLALSAKSEKALNDLAVSYTKFIELNPSAKLEDITFSANTGREAMSHRLAVVCESNEDLLRTLRHHADPDAMTNIFTGIVKPSKSPGIVFLFPGQGAQYTGMGKELYDTVPSFRNDINKCNEILKQYLPIELLQVLFSDSDESVAALDRTRYTQPALFAIEYALGKLWMSWGIVPSVMMGHSAGEYVAACLAGVFSLEDGLKLVAERGRLMEEKTGDGEMFTIFADESTTRNLLKGFEDRVSIASMNSPVKTVISGDKEAVNKVIAQLDQKQIEYKKINVSIASHSPMMIPMIEEFKEVCRSVRYSEARIPVVSNINAEITSDKISNADYWCDHILSPVEFSKSILTCVNSGNNNFIDLGPKPTSLSMAQETIQSNDLTWIASFKKNFTTWQTLSEGLARLFVNGVIVNWEGYHNDFAGSKISLPHYPFQRQRYWVADQISSADASIGSGIQTGKTLLGSKANSASRKQFMFNTRLKADEPGYLSGHNVFDKTVFPGAGYSELALSAASEVFGKDSVRLEDIKFHAPLFLDDKNYSQVQTIVTLDEKGKAEVEIFSMNSVDNNWMLQASAKAKIISAASKEKFADIESMNGDTLLTETFYEDAKKEGIDYREAFRGLSVLNSGKDVMFAEAQLPAGEKSNGYSLHPALLDMSFQTALADIYRTKKSVYVPASIESLTLYKPVESSRVYISAELSRVSSKHGDLKYDLKILNSDRELCAVVKKLRLAEVNREDLLGESGTEAKLFYGIKWKPAPEESITSVSFNADKFVKYISGHEQIISPITDMKRLSKYRKSIYALDELVAFSILQAIRDAGVEIAKGKLFKVEGIAESIGVAGNHKKLFARLLEVLEESGLIAKTDDGFEFTPDATILLDTKPYDTFLEKHKHAEHEFEFVRHCGEKLKDVLTGNVDAISVLFPEGNFTMAEKIYRDSPGFELMNNTVSRILSKLYHSVNGGRKLRILEIGAGTGSTTIGAVKDLSSKKAEYVFTDISPVFFENAKRVLNEKDFIEYKTLDIEQDPSSQGFTNESFDVVIASNVIHATKDLEVSLKNIRGLLRKDGVLILNEATEKRAWIDLTFGMTEGWWRFEDQSRRMMHPLLNGEQWNNILRDSGFGDINLIAAEDELNRTYSGQHIIVSSKTRMQEDESNTLTLIISRSDLSEKVKLKLTKSIGNIVFANDSFAYEIKSNDNIELDLKSESDVERLLTEKIIASAKKVDIVYVASVDEKISTADPSEETLQHCIRLLNIVKALKSAVYEQSPELKIVTRNSQQIISEDEIEGLSESSLWGLGRVINLEHPELNVKMIDTDESTDISTAISGALSDDNENFIAFRKGKKYIARISEAKVPAKHSFVPKKHFAYLITGGFSGIGLLSARLLADMGARNLILAGRRGTSQEAEQLRDELVKRRIKVLLVKADVSVADDVDDIFEIAKENGLKIKGIIHSAGVLDDAVIMNQTMEKFRNVLEPKAKSAWLLYERTKKSALQFYLMYSSIASVLGSAGQANHSSANSFLDSLSKFIQAKGLRAMSINWGVWSDVGSAAEKGADKQEKISGIETISPSEGISALRKVFDSNIAQLGVFKIDWNKYNSQIKNSLTSEMISEETTQEELTGKKNVKESLADKLSHTEEQDQLGLLQEYFRKLISSIMGLEPEDIEPDIPLSSMGLDSLMAIELKNRVNIELGVNLNLVRYMEETDINQLSSELKEQIPKLLDKSANVANAKVKTSTEKSEEEKARDLLAGLDNLSEEELDKLLKEMN